MYFEREIETDRQTDTLMDKLTGREQKMKFKETKSKIKKKRTKKKKENETKQNKKLKKKKRTKIKIKKPSLTTFSGQRSLPLLVMIFRGSSKILN